MTVVRVDFRASNNADWERAFSLTVGNQGPAPWAAVPEWDPETVYSPASVVQKDGDLYVGTSAPTQGLWNVNDWVLIGSKTLFTRIPYDLTGAVLKMSVKKENEPQTPVLTATIGEGLQFSNPSEGGIVISIPAARTKGVTAGAYDYDLLIMKDGKTSRALYGKITVDEGVTR